MRNVLHHSYDAYECRLDSELSQKFIWYYCYFMGISCTIYQWFVFHRTEVLIFILTCHL